MICVDAGIQLLLVCFDTGNGASVVSSGISRSILRGGGVVVPAICVGGVICGGDIGSCWRGGGG